MPTLTVGKSADCTIPLELKIEILNKAVRNSNRTGTEYYLL